MDSDGDILQGIFVQVNGIEEDEYDWDGIWEYSLDRGNTWNALISENNYNARYLTGSSYLRFVPDKNFNGTNNLSFRMLDSSVDLTPVPYLTKPESPNRPSLQIPKLAGSPVFEDIDGDRPGCFCLRALKGILYYENLGFDDTAIRSAKTNPFGLDN